MSGRDIAVSVAFIYKHCDKVLDMISCMKNRLECGIAVAGLPKDTRSHPTFAPEKPARVSIG
jgi:hypothetical protein